MKRKQIESNNTKTIQFKKTDAGLKHAEMFIAKLNKINQDIPACIYEYPSSYIVEFITEKNFIDY